MTGHRATVTVDGVRWELHADGRRTAMIGERHVYAELVELGENKVWALIETGGPTWGIAPTFEALAIRARQSIPQEATS